jgi:phosphopantothenoylcysteine decarboxylase/phosphopantothenate--cysteine ligase
MFDAVMNELPKATVFIGAAAVADYRPNQRAAAKIKKNESSMVLTLERTRDILGEVASARTNGLLVIGFAAETNDVLINAQEKLRAKNLDVVVANDVTRVDAGFDSTENAVTIVGRGAQGPIELPLMPKLEAAHRILDEIVRLRANADCRLPIANCRFQES